MGSPCLLLTTAGSRVGMRLKTDNRIGDCLILDLLFKYLEREGQSSKLEEFIFQALHSRSERYIFLSFTLFVFAAVALRHINGSSESYYGARFVFCLYWPRQFL